MEQQKMKVSAVNTCDVIKRVFALMRNQRGVARWMMPPVAVFLLSGCGPEMLKPSVPLDVPLTPVAVYVNPCPPPKNGILAVFGAMDRAPGEATCAVFWAALQERLAEMHKPYVLLRPKNGEGKSKFEPDLVAEKQVGALYRVVLTPPWSYRSYSSDGGGGHMEWIETSMNARFISISDGKQLGGAFLTGRDSPMNMAKYFSNRIVKGIEGPRCQPMNGWSMKATFKTAFSGPKCDSVALHADDDDD